MSVLQELLNIVDDNTPKGEEIEACACAVCGNQTTNGFKFTSLFSRSTFNLNHEVRAPDSDYVCSHCAVFFSRENWRLYCERNNLDPFFARVKGKKPFLANWMFFSHYFANKEHKVVKKRQDWREYLISPPVPPFCFVITTLAKKHLLFKAEISYSQDNYPIRFEDKIIYINIDSFRTVLATFEILYSAGLSKSSIKTGNYNSSMLLKVDKKIFMDSEEVIKIYRVKNPNYLEVCEFIGAKNV
jgi:hypothetical protein